MCTHLKRRGKTIVVNCREFIKYIEKEDTHTWRGVLLAACLLIIGILIALIYNWHGYWKRRSAMCVRIITSAVVYRKVSFFCTCLTYLRANEGFLKGRLCRITVEY